MGLSNNPFTRSMSEKTMTDIVLFDRDDQTEVDHHMSNDQLNYTISSPSTSSSPSINNEGFQLMKGYDGESEEGNSPVKVHIKVKPISAVYSSPVRGPKLAAVSPLSEERVAKIRQVGHHGKNKSDPNLSSDEKSLQSITNQSVSAPPTSSNRRSNRY